MSKRGMDMQGGFERYGGSSNGPETPMDTPTRATPEQLARRKIAGLKGRPRPTSPVKSAAPPSFGFGTTNQQPAQTSTQPTFNFSAQPSATNDNPFGQSQSTTSSAFSFGQSTPNSNTPFTFGSSNTSNAGGFSFGLPQPDSSDQGGIRNPFAQGNGQNTMQTQSSAPSTNGFNFNFGAPKDVSTTTAPASSSNIFSFGATADNKLSESEQREVIERQLVLDTEQLKKFEDLVKDHLPLWDTTIKSQSLAQLPSATQRKLLDFIRSLPALSGNETRASFGLFGDHARGRTREWVTDAQRTQIKQAGAGMSPEQQDKLAQVARDECSALAQVKSAQFPSLEQLPHDVQHKMLQHVQAATKPAVPTASSLFDKTPENTSTASNKANAFTFPSQPASPAPPAPQQVPKNIFSNISANATTAERRQSMGEPPSSETAAPSSVPKSDNPKTSFSFGASADSTASAAPKPTSQSFSFTPQQSASPSQPPAFNFGNNNNQSRSQPSSSATVQAPASSSRPAETTGQRFAMRSLNRALLKHLATCSKDDDWSAALKTYIELTATRSAEPAKTSAPQVNGAESKSQSSASSSSIYAQSQSSPDAPLFQPTTSSNGPTQASSVGSKRKAEEEHQSSRNGQTPAKQPAPSTASFQFTPQKPLSQTASLFNDILQSPDKSQQQPPAVSGTAAKPPSNLFSAPTAQSQPVSTTPSLFQPPQVAAPTAAAPPKPPSFSVPPTTNFMAAFGQAAQKQAAKEKAQRKAEEFDSDDDDEAEWEQKEKERQEAKAAEIRNASKKQMKMVDGKFIWVDESESVATNTIDTPDAAAKPASASSSAATQNGTPPANPFANLINKSTVLTNNTSPDTPKPASMFSPPASGLGQSIFADKPSQPSSLFNFNSSAGKESTTPAGSPAKPFTGFSFGGSASSQTSDDAASASAPKAFNFGATAQPSSLFSNNSTSLFSTPSTGSSASGPSLSSNTGNSASSSVFGTANTANAPSSTSTTQTNSGNNDDEDDGETTKDEQRDLTALSATEVKTEAVLFEQKARCRKFARGETPWENKGVGILRLLKNKETGSVRILMRQDPSGNILLNASLIRQKDMYSLMNEKIVKLVVTGAEKELLTYSAAFGTADKAKELLEAIHGLL